MRVSVLQQPTPRAASEPVPQPICGLGGRGRTWKRLYTGSAGQNCDYYMRLPSGRWFTDLYTSGLYRVSDDDWQTYRQFGFTPDSGWSGRNTMFWPLGGDVVLAMFHQMRNSDQARQRKVYKSWDSGEIWTYLTTLWGWAFGGEWGGWPFHILDDGSLFCAQDSYNNTSRADISTDGGTIWTSVMTYEALNGPHSGVAVRGNVVVMGHVNQGFQVSYDYGRTWSWRTLPASECQALGFLDRRLVVGMRGGAPGVYLYRLTQPDDVLLSSWSGKWQASSLIPLTSAEVHKFTFCVEAPWGGLIAGFNTGRAWWSPSWLGAWEELNASEVYDGTYPVLVQNGVVYIGKTSSGLYRYV